jgi:CRP-like cAMP-binding protein
MPPKAMNYKANSIVYFKGDAGDNIFILQKGQVSLNYQDIQTGQEIHDFVQTGEFFGVKAAFGKYPHDETAVVLLDSVIIQFSVDDFEHLLSSNDRVIMKMLKVFSNQLRRIHNQVQSLLSKEEETNLEKGLYSVGDYYFNNKKYKQAVDAFNRYLTYYPAGRFEPDIRKKIQYSETNLKRSNPTGQSGAGGVVPSNSLDRAKGLQMKGNYTEAYAAYIRAIQRHPEVQAEAEFEAGVCLFHLEKFTEVIRHFSEILKHNPSHSKTGECLYYIGKSYFSENDRTKAKSFLTKADSYLPVGTPEKKDTQNLIDEMEE